MSGFRSHSKVETWTVSELVDATSLKPTGRRKVTIPVFQRRLVWSDNKQMALIDSIKKGYPFGSLLIYRDDQAGGNQENYKLIDGLQRTQALRRYCIQPNSSFSKNDLSETLISIIAGELNRLTNIDCMTKTNLRLLRSVILHWIWDGKGYRESDGWSVEALTNEIIRKVLELDEDCDGFEFYQARKTLLESTSTYKEPLSDILNSIRNESDISEAEVPVIVYTGESKEITKVFELLNTQGTKLSPYEVFAAQWLDHRQRIENSKIIEAIWNKYEALEKYGYDLDVSTEAPDEQSRRDRPYTLFEYVFGLGQLITETFPQLFKPAAVDVPASAGFNLMSACLGLGVNASNMALMPEVLGNTGVELKTLENCILESTAIVDATLQPILAMQPENQTKTEYYHSETAIISMIASAFHFRYQLHNGISDNPGWEERRVILLQNIPMYYLFDILRDYWRGSGDSKLMRIITESSYLKPISKSQWESIFNLWHINHVASRNHARIFTKYSFGEYLLLRYIYFDHIRHSEAFQVQHVVSTKRLLSQPSYYANNSGPINSIGNLALIPEGMHEIDLEDYKKYVQRHSNGRDKEFKTELRECERQFLCNIDIFPSELTQNAFETFLLERFELLKREFFTVWRDHIPKDSQN